MQDGLTMMIRRRKLSARIGKVRSFLRAISAASMLMSLAACGGTSTNTGSSGNPTAVAQAKQALAQYAAEITLDLSKLPKFDGTKLKGHKAGYVPITPNIPVTVVQYGAWKKAMDAAGVKTIEANTD